MRRGKKNSKTKHSSKIIDFGVSSMVSTLKTVGMLKPMEAIKRADPNIWHYGQAVDPSKIESNYSSFIKILTRFDVEILWMTPKNNANADSIFTYDPSFMTQKGAILLSPGTKQASNC